MTNKIIIVKIISTNTLKNSIQSSVFRYFGNSLRRFFSKHYMCETISKTLLLAEGNTINTL